MFYGSSPHYHEEITKTPREKARDLLLELNLEQRREKKDLDKLVNLKSQLCAFHIKDLVQAFDEVADKHGWGDVTKPENSNGRNRRYTDRQA